MRNIKNNALLFWVSSKLALSLPRQYKRKQPMAELRMLSVSFDTHLLPWQLPQFRGAIAEKVGLEHEWFHNHDNENGGFHQRYPLIQYKIDGHQKQLRPMLLCMQAGVEEAHRYFSQPDWTLRIGGQDHTMRIARLNVQQHHLRVTDKPQTYRIHHWKPFNPENYQHFRNLRGIAEQYTFLESLLTSHILAFATGVGWQLDERFQIKITELVQREWVDYKGLKVLAFTLDFEGNVGLPGGVGLGKGASMGYGVVRGREMNAKTDKNNLQKTER